MTANEKAEAEDGAALYVASLCRQFSVPSLRTYGLKPEQIAELAEKVTKASSTKSNPIPLTRGELVEIAERAL